LSYFSSNMEEDGVKRCSPEMDNKCLDSLSQMDQAREISEAHVQNFHQ
jgi:hypothetical protein